MVIAFFCLLATKGTVSYVIYHDGEVVNYPITQELKMSSTFGGFMIFLYFADIVAAITVLDIKAKYLKSVYALIGVVVFDFILMLRLFDAHSEMAYYTPKTVTPGWIPHAKGLTISGAYSVCVFMMVVGVIAYIICYN